MRCMEDISYVLFVIMFFFRFLMRFILMIDVIMFFSMLNILFSFRVSNIRKNNMDYIGVVGSWLMVFVKVMKVSLVLDLFWILKYFCVRFKI